VEYDTLNSVQAEESSAVIRSRVCRARDIQNERYFGKEIMTNEQIGKYELERYCCLDPEGQNLMELAFTKLSLTARSYYKIIKVARTIADLAGSKDIGAIHLREAIGYRMIDKKYWRR